MTKPVSKKTAAAIGLATLIAVPFEGLREKAYYDPPGILTVCYGSTTNVVKGKTYTLRECKDRLDADMLKAVQAVERFAPAAPTNVTAAFGDAVYNLGPGHILGPKSTAAGLLKAKKWSSACNELPKWNKARVLGISVALPGLTSRRAAERDVCLTP